MSNSKTRLLASARAPVAKLRVATLAGMLAAAILGPACSQGSESIGRTSAAVDTICGGAPVASIDGIPAYSYCGNFDVYSNNGVDTRSYGGAGWVKTEGGYGYQCDLTPKLLPAIT